MKKLMGVLCLVVLLSQNLFANDGGSAYLEVMGINPEGISKSSLNWEKPVLEFYGKEAKVFAQTLPAVSSVEKAMMSPQDAKLYDENEKSLSFVSNGYLLTLNCSGGQVQSLDSTGSKLTYVVSQDPRGFRCSLRLMARTPGDNSPLTEMLGDAFKYEDAKSFCEMN